MFKDIKFLGIGSAFSSDFGPTSFVYQIHGNLYIFEANESTFQYFKSKSDFTSVKKYIFKISHFHEDHIGCLGNCLAWLIFALKVDISDIIIDTLDVNTLKTYLSITMPCFKDITINEDGFEVTHSDGMICCGFRLRSWAINDRLDKLSNFMDFVYTGDCNNIPNDILQEFNDGKIYLITECSIYDNVEVHQYLPYLLNKINLKYLNNLLLVHHDSLETFEKSLIMVIKKFSKLKLSSSIVKEFVLNEVKLLPKEFEYYQKYLQSKLLTLINVHCKEIQ